MFRFARLPVLLAVAFISTACLRPEQAMVTPFTKAEGTRPPVELVVNEQDWEPFATIAGLVLHHPSRETQMIGYHESNNDGAQQMAPAATDTQVITMSSRGRGNGSRSAADVVIAPDLEVRSPVTGRVLRAGTYVLYCAHQDDFVVIEPDARPGWEVKMLHIDGVTVKAGDRVEAGVTRVAPRATVLPFTSQIDEFTATPSWPHVHIEVVDPSIPDRPGAGC